MSDILEKFPQLKDAYAGDDESLARIKAEEERVTSLLSKKAYYDLPETKELIALCHKEIVDARLQLSSSRTLAPEKVAALWFVIDARQWFLTNVARDFDAELVRIDQELQIELDK